MKDIGPALRAFLLGDASISTAVGGARIYPDKLPQGEARDSISYHEVFGTTGLHNEGSDNLTEMRMQITSWSRSRDGAVSLALAVKGIMHGYRGTMGSGASLVTVQGARFDGIRPLYDDTAKLYGRAVDFIIWYEEV